MSQEKPVEPTVVYELRCLVDGQWTTDYALTEDGVVRSATVGEQLVAAKKLREIEGYEDARLAVVTIEDGEQVATNEI